jgi:ankyrin repeat protein
MEHDGEIMAACRNGASSERLETLFAEHYGPPKEKGFSILHEACLNQAPFQVVAYIVRQQPNLARQATADGGWLPLHFAAGNQASVEVLQFLSEQYPDALQSQGGDGKANTPLHEASYNEASLPAIQCLLHKDPAAAALLADGLLPLHLALVRSKPAAVIQALVDAYPEGVRIPEQHWGHQTLALHMACASKASGDVRVVLQPYPAAALVANADGCLPLHLALNSNPEAVLDMVDIQALVKANPDALQKPHPMRGLLPLALACLFPRPVELVACLYEAWPAAVTVPTAKEGYLPLLVACCGEDQSLLSVVEFLVGAAAESCQAKDNYGNTPLHYACMRGSPAAVVQFLLKQDPASARVRLPACRINSFASGLWCDSDPVGGDSVFG